MIMYNKSENLDYDEDQVTDIDDDDDENFLCIKKVHGIFGWLFQKWTIDK